MPRSVISCLLPILFWTTLFVHAANPATSTDDLFSPTHLHTIHIHLSKQAWDLLQPGAGSRLLHSKARAPSATDIVSLRNGSAGDGYAYVKSTLDFDGQSLPSVALRFKGNFSYSVSSHTLRRPFKLDFERFGGQRFAGLSSLNLSNQTVDPSQMREMFAFDTFNHLGVPAPRTGFALVYLTVTGQIDCQYLGLYTLIEDIDHHFLKRHFGTAEGLLLKPSGMRGLAYFGESWAPYESRYLPKTPADPKFTQRIIDLARLIHRADDAEFAAHIAAYLDVDDMLGYVAATAAIANFDSFVSTGHNYFLYVHPDTLRISILPWDMNMSFGGYSWVGTQEQIEDLSILHPYVDHNRLIERLLAIPAYRDVYRRDIQKIVDGPFARDHIRQRIAALAPIFAAADRATGDSGQINSPTTRPATANRVHPPDLLQFIDQRAISMRSQLEGRQNGYIPDFRNPDRVPEGWSKLSRPAYALLEALDTDADGRISPAEFASVTALLWKQAAIDPKLPLDEATLTRILDQLLTAEMRQCAPASAWSKWLIRISDHNKTGQLQASQLQEVFDHLLAAQDRDYDGMIGGRELLEGLGGIGVP